MNENVVKRKIKILLGKIRFKQHIWKKSGKKQIFVTGDDLTRKTENSSRENVLCAGGKCLELNTDLQQKWFVCREREALARCH